jgi:hypothetical protein
MLETHPLLLKKPVDFPLQISSQSYPLTLSWHVAQGASFRYSLTSVDKSSAAQSVPMKGDGTRTIPSGNLVLQLHVEENRLPERFALYQNYPNPFNPTTTIRYDLPAEGSVKLIVYDILGKEVATLVDNIQKAGFYEIPFSAEQFASGVYFYRLTAGSFTSVQKMMIVK